MSPHKPPMLNNSPEAAWPPLSQARADTRREHAPATPAAAASTGASTAQATSTPARRIDLLGLAELDAAPPEPTEFPYLVGMPPARDARAAQRRAFVEMKQLFMHAVADLAHRKGAWLRSQVRAAEDPIDLWLLRGPLLGALREDDAGTRAMRAALYKSLDAMFPHGFGVPDAGGRPVLRV